jgi:CNT family concentrative nucleoside transporter
MRLIGVVGFAVILGIALLFSTNRRAIKPRVLIWGFSLQFLFAAIILKQNVVSWICMFLFAFLILLYTFKDKLPSGKIKWSGLLPAFVILLMSAFVTLIAFYLDRLQAAALILGCVVLALIVLIVLKKRNITRYLFASALLIALGMIFQRGIYGKDIFAALGDKVDRFLRLTDLGSTFLFGNLVKPEYSAQFGLQFAFAILPTIIFFSAVMSIGYYLGIMQAIVQMMARFMRWTLGTSGAETLSCTSNVFLGQTEAPLLIRPFLDEMTISELHAVMVGGFGTIAGGVMAGYMRMGISPGLLIAASVMAAPAALVMAKIFLPETEHSKTAGDVDIPDVGRADNLLDAAARGVTDGLKLAVNVGAMLLAFIALIGLVDMVLGFADRMIDGRLLSGVLLESSKEYGGIFPGSLKTLLGTLFAPLAFVMGVPWKEAADVGNLIGIKISVNEFVAYSELGKQIHASALSVKSVTIATFALCGFANFSSIGIQIGGIGALTPKRRSDLSRIALRAMVAGALTSCTTATIAGLLL